MLNKSKIQLVGITAFMVSMEMLNRCTTIDKRNEINRMCQIVIGNEIIGINRFICTILASNIISNRIKFINLSFVEKPEFFIRKVE